MAGENVIPAASAAAGGVASFLNPLGAILGGLGSALSAAPAGPSQAGGNSQGGAAWDSSGWNVTFGNNSGISSSREQTPALSLAGLTGNPLMLAGLAVVAVVVIKKMRRRS